MESDITSTFSTLIIHFTTYLNAPFGLKYRLDPISLDPTLFSDSELVNLKSFTVSTVTGSDLPDLEINSIFEINVNTDSREYKRIIANMKPGPPIKDELFYKIEDKHKTLAYGIVKYLAWRKDIFISDIHTKNKASNMSWEFNGVSSSQMPKPQWIFGGHYEAYQEGIFDFSGIDLKHFYKLYDSGLEIPIHQELLTEVNSLLYSQKRRSTYLILYTTLEVATKALIRTLRPDTDYLISKMPSPDLFNLYTQYINIEINKIVNAEEAKTLKNMASVRNNIAHRGEGVSMDILSRHYEFVKSLVKRIDIAMGYI